MSKAVFNSYFSGRVILSRGAMLNLVLSDRSDGKTFDVKLRALLDYYYQNLITVVVRRYKTEMGQLFYANFFGEVLEKETSEIKGLTEQEQVAIDEIKTWEFRFERDKVSVRKEGKKWDVIVFFLPLTMSGKKKSAFNDYVSRIKYISFDEYVPLDGRYAPNEMNAILELYRSVDRDRFVVQMIILGNKIDPFCPFLDFFGIELDLTNAKTRLYRNGTLAVQIYASEEHREVRSTSRFQDLVSGTGYDAYANGGILKALSLKTKKVENANYWGSFITEVGEGTIWYDGDFIISTTIRKDGFVITDKIYNSGRPEYIVTYGRFAQLFKNAYRSGRMYFENDKAFHYFENILKKCGQCL